MMNATAVTLQSTKKRRTSTRDDRSRTSRASQDFDRANGRTPCEHLRSSPLRRGETEQQGRNGLFTLKRRQEAPRPSTLINTSSLIWLSPNQSFFIENPLQKCEKSNVEGFDRSITCYSWNLPRLLSLNFIQVLAFCFFTLGSRTCGCYTFHKLRQGP